MSSTKLKLIALFFMLIDHIAEFLPGIPDWFHWIGRISAPIFFFCMAWGFYYTKNRKKYLIRMYFFGIGMALISDIVSHFNHRQYVSIDNNIFVNLLIAAVLIWIIDIYRIDAKKGKYYLRIFFIVQISSTLIIRGYEFINFSNYISLGRFISALFGNIFACEGGLPFAILPVIFYYSKGSKKNLILSYTIFCIVYTLFYVTDVVGRIYMHLDRILPEPVYIITAILPSLLKMNLIPTYHVRFYTLLTDQWMMIFALPFMLLYNGTKGKGYKYLFYLFYPVHIFILYIIGNLIAR